MEEATTLKPIGPPENQQACISCGNPQILPGFPNALCSECREKYIKYPIPMWVKIFGSVVLALVIFSLFTLRKDFWLGIRYERGLKAEESKKYVTEQKIMQSVLKDNPDYLEAKADLLMAAFYNNDLATASDMSEKMLHQQFDDEDLLAKVNAVVAEADSEAPGDSLQKYLRLYPDSTGGIPDNIYKKIITEEPNDVFASAKYASNLIDKKNYQVADSLLKSVLLRKSNFIPALELEISINRLKSDTKDCLEYCNRLLAINSESVYALCCIARSYLKNGQVADGLQFAKKALKIQPDAPYANATMILAYHFNKMLPERDALINKIKQSGDSVMKGAMQYPLDVINHKDSI